MRALLRGGRIYAPSAPGATAMLVIDGTIAWLGPDHGTDADGGAVVDLAGALVTPAFVDAHVHHTMTGLTLLGLDLRGVASREAVLEQVARAAGRGDAGAILGHGWDESRWLQAEPPTAAELDRAAPGAPVYLSRVDVHSAVVSGALAAAVPGLAGMPGFGRTGLVRGAAHHAVRRHVTEQLAGDVRGQAQRATRRHAASRGIAALHEAGGPDIGGADDLRALLALAAEEPGPELVAYWGQPDGPEAALRLGASGAAGDVFVDGSLGSRTAWLRQPYADADTSGSCHLAAGQIAAHLVACTDAGVQAGFHAIGDAALDAVVEGLREAVARVGAGPLRAARHRIEHAIMAGPEHATALADAGVVASVQPSFDALWGGDEGTYATRLGQSRARRSHDLAGLARAGVTLALGSDSPVTTLEPWEWVRAAMWHHNPDARLSGRAAFAAATRGGWRAARRDDAGVLAVGAPATFAVWAADELVVQAPDARVAAWSTDPRSGTPGLPRLDPGTAAPDCLATVLDGRVIHASADPVGAALGESGSEV